MRSSSAVVNIPVANVAKTTTSVDCDWLRLGAVPAAEVTRGDGHGGSHASVQMVRRTPASLSIA